MALGLAGEADGAIPSCSLRSTWRGRRAAGPPDGDLAANAFFFLVL
jgi:hypothetical protein